MDKETEQTETKQEAEKQEQYIGTPYDFQKYLIDPEYRKSFDFNYLTKELGIANLQPIDIFLVSFDMETVYYLRFLGAINSERSFLADIFTTLGISRSKDGFGAKLLVTQITRGDYDIRGSEEMKRRFMTFGRSRSNEMRNMEGGGGTY